MNSPDVKGKKVSNPENGVIALACNQYAAAGSPLKSRIIPVETRTNQDPIG
jgi:hypothetical protein